MNSYQILCGLLGQLKLQRHRGAWVLLYALLGSGCGGEDVILEAAEEEPPILTITHPTPNAIMDDEFVTLRGTVTDNRGLEKLTVNGVPTRVEGDEFTVTLPLENMVTFETIATDKSGNTARDLRSVLRDRFEPFDEVRLGGVLRLLPESYDIILVPLTQALSNLDVTSTILAVQTEGPIVDVCVSSFSGSGCPLDARLQITISSVEFDRENLDLVVTPTEGGLAIEMVLNDIIINGYGGVGVIGAGTQTDITINMGRAIVFAELQISKDIGSELIVQTRGPVSVELPDPLTYEPRLGWDAADNIIGTVVSEIIETQVENTVNGSAVEAIKDALNSLSISEFIEVIEDTGVGFTVTGGLDKVRFNPEASNIGMYTAIIPGRLDEDEETSNETLVTGLSEMGTYRAKINAGSTEVFGVPVDNTIFDDIGIGEGEGYDGNAGLYDPFLDSTRPLQLAVHANVLNQILSSLWLANALDQEFDVLDDSGFEPGDDQQGANITNEDGPQTSEFGISTISIEAALPPVVTRDDELKLFRAHIGGLDVAFRSYVSGEELLRASVAASAPVSVATLGDGRLSIILDGTVHLAAQVNQVNENLITREQAALLLQLLDKELTRILSELLTEIAVPLVAGIKTENATSRSYDQYVVIEGDILIDESARQRNFFTDVIVPTEEELAEEALDGSEESESGGD